jgi:hypothetical protein
MSDGAPLPSENPHGLDLLPRDLTPDELAAAPVLDSLDELLLDLTDDEDEAFAAALAS